jgi:uncharacterized surface anchored protein
VEIPGSVLPGGRYVFRENDVTATKHQVLIYDYVTGILVANLPTTPEELNKKVEGNIRLEPRPSPFQGQVVAEWFRPGSRIGEQFIYTPGMMVGEATMTATAADIESANADLTAAPNGPVAAETAATESTTESTMRPAETVVVPTPAQEQAQSQPATTTPQSPETPATAPAATASDNSGDATGTMPKTASEIPLIAAIGASALFLAGLFWLLRSRMAKPV